jgi:hypothetical protein
MSEAAAMASEARRRFIERTPLSVGQHRLPMRFDSQNADRPK